MPYTFNEKAVFSRIGSKGVSRSSEYTPYVGPPSDFAVRMLRENARKRRDRQMTRNGILACMIVAVPSVLWLLYSYFFVLKQ
jgi:hypothetical protein